MHKKYNTLFMKFNKLVKKKRGEKGKGRATIFKQINLPEDVIEDIKLYRDIYGIKFSPNKDEYGNSIPVRISYEQIIRRWMDNVGRFDPEVQSEVLAVKEYRKNNPAVTYPVDQTEGDVWDMRYFFEKDGEQLEAKAGDMAPFYARLNGRNVGIKALLEDEWVFMNEVGIEITMDQAIIIRDKIKKHQSEVSKL